MIPEEKKIAVKNALQTAFGVTEFEDIRAMNAGLSSALIFRMVVKGNPYLLRVVTRTDAHGDIGRWYGSMKAAADAGLAPKVWYVNMEGRILITDFIEARSFPIKQARIIMPEILKRLHLLPAFTHRVNYLDVLSGFIQKLQAAKCLPESITDELSREYEQIKSAYRRIDSDMVSSHNDLKSENFLFDGERVWLVDWEAAFINDRYFDLAVVANFVAANEQEEKDYLERYFGREVGEYELARFFMMRQMLHVSYFTFFMYLGHAPGEQIEVSLPVSNFRDFSDQVWTGRITLENNDARQQYAWVHLEQLKQNLQSKRFRHSMKIIAEYQTS